MAGHAEPGDDPNRRDEELLSIIAAGSVEPPKSGLPGTILQTADEIKAFLSSFDKPPARGYTLVTMWNSSEWRSKWRHYMDMPVKS